MKILLLSIISVAFFGFVAFAQSDYPIIYDTEDEVYASDEEIPEDLSTALDTSTFQGDDTPASYSYDQKYGGFDIDDYESENPFDYGYEAASDGGEGSKYDATDMMGVDEYTYGENWDQIYEERQYHYYGREDGGHHYGVTDH